jgi:hypothetical protein
MTFFKLCLLAIEDDKKRSGLMKVDREVMDVLKLVLDGEFADKDFLPELLKMNKGKLVKGILTLIPRVVACDVKIDKFERKVEKYKSRYSNACDSLLSDNYKMIHTIACLNSEIELLKLNVSCDSYVGMLAENEKLKLDYSTCVEQLEIAGAEIIKINFMYSSTCSSTLNIDTCIDSNDNHDVLLDINASNVSTISCTSCNDLKHDLVDACHENNLFKAKLDDSHIDVSPLKSLHNNMSDKDCGFCLVVIEDLAKL